MPGFVKLIVGPSPHYHQLQSGKIKHQKSKPANPIWRVLIADEGNNKMHLRFFPGQPCADEVERAVIVFMEAQALLGGKVMVPATVEKLCPGIREKLQAKGANIYVPDNGFAAGSGIGKLAEDFLGSLKGWLGFVLEDMASCNEIEATAGNCMGFVTTALRREEDKENASSHIGHTIAEAICRLRGHDPAIQNKEYIAQTEAHLREVISRRQERSTT